MTLGIAVFILGCFWFYFKEPGFRKAVHVSGAVLGVLTLLSCLVAGAWYLKNQHDEKIEQARLVRVQACKERGETLNPTDDRWNAVAVEGACQQNPDADLSKVVIANAGVVKQTQRQSVDCSHVVLPAGFEDAKPMPDSTPCKVGTEAAQDDGFIPSIHAAKKPRSNRPTFPQTLDTPAQSK